MLTLISFNCNSVRKRLESGQIQRIIEKYQPQLIALQETKVEDQHFPMDDFAKLGYQYVYCHGQKTHYGVALVSKLPLEEIRYGFPWEEDSDQKRLISAKLVPPDGQPLWVINGYFPQGENRAHPVKFPYKQSFYAKLNRLLDKYHSPDEAIMVMGDMNISPKDTDIGIGDKNRLRWLQTGKCSFLPEERVMLDKLLGWGLSDCYRIKNPHSDDTFSWFDYRSRGFDDSPKRGLRIDLQLVTPALGERLNDCGIDYEIRAMPTPSDHAPVWASFRCE